MSSNVHVLSDEEKFDIEIELEQRKIDQKREHEKLLREDMKTIRTAIDTKMQNEIKEQYRKKHTGAWDAFRHPYVSVDKIRSFFAPELAELNKRLQSERGPCYSLKTYDSSCCPNPNRLCRQVEFICDIETGLPRSQTKK